MIRFRAALTLIVGLVLVAATAAAETPSAEAIIASAIDAAVDEDAPVRHEMIRAAVREEETTSDGKTNVREFSLLLYGEHLQSARLELDPDINVISHNGKGWATIHGQLDTRANAERLASGTVRQKIFPLILPFSLELGGLRPGKVTQTTFDDRPAWAVEVTFDQLFFASASMATPWTLYFDRENHRVLGAEFYPPEDLRGPGAEGVRYRILTREKIGDLSLPGQILLDGLDFNGIENGHVRVTKISYSDAGSFDPTLFIDPATLEKLDAGDVE
jgi:hypothetical protein